MITLLTASRVAALFWPAFDEQRGCVVFAGGSYPQLGEFATRTAAEAFYSHRHILEEFRHSIPLQPTADDPEIEAPDREHPDFVRACELARIVAAMWLRKLESDFPGQQFRVYVTTRDDPIVRFHRVYASEPPWASDEETTLQRAAGEVIILASDTAARAAV